MNPVLKRVLIVLASLLLIVYVGVQGYLIFSASTDTITVDKEVAYETIKTTGLVYRSESVIREQTDGYIFYTVEDGNRVSKNGNIAHVFPAMEDALGQQELERLDEEIALLTSINAQGSSNRAGLSSINQQIDKAWLSLSHTTQLPSYGNVEELHSQLLALLNKKQLTIGREENFNKRLAQLNEKRAALVQSFTPATSTVSSPVAGYFVSSADGYEETLPSDRVGSLSVADLEAALQLKPSVDPTNFVGKIVGDYEWYLACILPMESTTTLKRGTVLEVCMPFVQSQPLTMTVFSLNKSSDDRVAVVLQCTQMSAALSTIRKEQIEIRLKQYEGMIVPDDAIHFDDKDQAGVYVQDGNILRFRRIQVVYHNAEERYSVCALRDNKA